MEPPQFPGEQRRFAFRVPSRLMRPGMFRLSAQRLGAGQLARSLPRACGRGVMACARVRYDGVISRDGLWLLAYRGTALPKAARFIPSETLCTRRSSDEVARTADGRFPLRLRPGSVFRSRPG